MKKLLRLSLLLLALAAAGSLRAQRDIGTVEVLAENKTLPVRVSANTPELNQLALQAFGTHGRYRLVASEAHHSFGHDLVGEQWELDLGPG